MNKGHRSELHPHTNTHTQMHISKTCKSMFAGSEITRYTNTCTTSASKTRMKHGHWSEVATHTHKHTNSRLARTMVTINATED